MKTPEAKISPLPPQRSKSFPLSSIIGKSLIAAALVAGGITAIGSLTGGAAFWSANRAADNVSDANKEARIQSFAAMAPIRLVPVSDQDIAKAIGSMQLSASAKQALLSDLSASPIEQAATGALPLAQPAKPVAVPAASPSGAAKPARVRLAWITVWDTDTEDGDVVRIDSQGYTRTVTLTTQPVTFAIPVPADGIVKVTGMLDGEGGGITVGLASGASKAVFPIMSVGQVLGLHVKMN